ncbi:MAG: hypothetical protein WAP57_13435 [Aquabacterium commune]|uniref:hypothetical protein n=1 Tax=Aquabacterium commune TaxID=70586 RepID=UPI00105F621B|nr:hypothetical protein [Aquabacterium commune]
MDLEAALIIVQLAGPVAVFFAPARRLQMAFAIVFGIQCLAIWHGGCVTSTWQCPNSCKWFFGTCERVGDGNDAAPFGIALLALVSLAGLAVATGMQQRRLSQSPWHCLSWA